MPTWLGALVHGAVVDLVKELWAVVVHVDDVDVQVNGVLHLVAVHVHSVGSQLGATGQVRAGGRIKVVQRAVSWALETAEAAWARVSGALALVRNFSQFLFSESPLAEATQGPQGC